MYMDREGAKDLRSSMRTFISYQERSKRRVPCPSPRYEHRLRLARGNFEATSWTRFEEKVVIVEAAALHFCSFKVMVFLSG